MDSHILDLQNALIEFGAIIVNHPNEINPRMEDHTGEYACASWDWNTHVYDIYYPESGPNHFIYHELLHLEYFVKNGAGALISTAPEGSRMWKNILELNNSLDHAHIIAREISLYPDAETHWANDFSEKLDTADFNDLTELGLAKLKVRLFSDWAVLRFNLPTNPIRSVYQRHLADHDWLDSANSMAEGIHNSGYDKYSEVSIFREHLNLGQYPHPDSFKYFRYDLTL